MMVTSGNNSNGVCFVGNYVDLNTSWWELIKSPGRDQLTQVVSQINICNYLQTQVIIKRLSTFMTAT